MPTCRATRTRGRPGHTTVGLMTMGSSKKGMRAATSGSSVANPGSESHGPGRDAALEGQGGPPPPDAPMAGQHVVADPASGDDQRGETATPEPG